MATSKKKARAPVARRIQLLPVDRLVPSTENGRRPVSNNSLKSLARSIKRNGVLQPILVRVHPEQPDSWEIRAGYRRWRAAKLAGLETIPAIVGKLDDEAALAVTITENLQRENLHPLEEAAVIQKALDHGFDVEAVAARLGKNPQFVARRASLTRLTEPWRKAVISVDSPASRLSPAHLELIARLPDETQAALAEDEFYPVFSRGFPSVEELRRIIDGGLHTLAAMPWSPDDEALDPTAGACRNCPKRSGAHPLLFDPEEVPTNGKSAKDDRCLDAACFERKQVAHVQRCEAQLRGAHPNLALVQIGSGSGSSALHEAFGDRIHRVYAPRFVKASNPNAVPAMQVDGPKAGKLVYIDAGDPQMPGHKNGRRKDEKTDEKKPLTLDERRARHQKRRQAFVVKQVETQLRNLTVEDVSRMLAAKSADDGRNESPLEVLSLLLSFGTSGRADRMYHEDPWDRYDRLRAVALEERNASAVHDVLQIWIRRLTMHDSSRVGFQAFEAQRMCKILGINHAEIEAEAVRTLPQPKSWGLPPEEAPSDVSSDEQAAPEGIAVAPSDRSADAGGVTDGNQHAPRPKSARRKAPNRKKSRKRVRAA
ncbi:MAG: ParB/RepB/Spo0J family partition protein [Phycisphaerae bacterium]|nr:ParB/RepB/Spo0J family partition protein [Phycisphaerae bacterium]